MRCNPRGAATVTSRGKGSLAERCDPVRRAPFSNDRQTSRRFREACRRVTLRACRSIVPTRPATESSADRSMVPTFSCETSRWAVSFPSVLDASACSRSCGMGHSGRVATAIGPEAGRSAVNAQLNRRRKSRQHLRVPVVGRRSGARWTAAPATRRRCPHSVAMRTE